MSVEPSDKEIWESLMSMRANLEKISKDHPDKPLASFRADVSKLGFSCEKIDEERPEKEGGFEGRRPLPDNNSLLEKTSFQSRVQDWLVKCFGKMVAKDHKQRTHRFLEESLELAQATGCTATEAYQLVDYVYGRDIGDRHQEVGGTMLTLAALCQAQGIDMESAAEDELKRVWKKIHQIRAKRAAAPKNSPLPQ